MSSKRESPEESVHQRTLERVSDAIISVDTDFQYTYLNQKAEELLGKTQSELLGEVIWDAFPETQNTIAQDRIEKALHTNQKLQYERYNESVGCWFEVRVFPDTGGLSIFFSDITERKEREIELERYEQIIETLPIAVGQNAPGSEGKFEYVNQGMVKMFGLESKEKAKQYSPADLYADPQAREMFNEKIQAKGEVHDFELEFENPSGERFWGSATASLDTIDGEEYFVGVIQDVSERREYKHKLRDLHNATREMVSALTPEDIADIVTRTADQSIGYEMNGVHFYNESVDGLVPASVSETSQDLIGDAPVLDAGIAWTAFQTGETQVCNNLEAADNVFNEGTVLRSELAIPLGNHGVLLASDTEIEAFRDDDLTLIKILAKNAETALNQLQTEESLRNRERELARQREFLTQTQEVANVGGWEVDMRTESLRWTDEVYRIHGKPFEYQPTIEDGLSFYHPDDRDTIRDAFERVTADGEPYDLELRIVRNAGEVRWVRTRGEPWYQDEEIVGVRGTLQDITERKEREEELSRHKELLNTLFEYSPIHLFVKDRKCRHLWTSSALVDNPDEYKGKHELEVDGSGKEAFCIESLREDRRVIHGKHHITDKEEYNEKLDKWLLTSKVPWYDKDGAIAGLLGYSVDITDRKAYEEKLEQQNERLDEFASLISHDLRNPLTVALGRTTFLQEMCDGKVAEQLAVVADSLDRIEQIIENTLTLARKGDAVGDMAAVSLAEVAGNCWQAVDTAEATLDFKQELTVSGDANRLKHVFENLFRNAVEHGTANVTITIGRNDGTGFYVEDDGPGIPEDDRDTVFEAGYTSERDGTGLGLAIVKRIAEAHGWEVTVTDGANGGARFEFENVEFADIQ